MWSHIFTFDAWVGALAGQDAILGMDFMVPAGIRLDLADGTVCLADEVRIQLSGRRPPYGRSRYSLLLEDDVLIPVAGAAEVPLKPPRALDREKLWIVRGEGWVPTVVKGLGRRRHLRITNVGDQELHLPRSTELGMWLAEDLVPRVPGHVSVGSRRYAEWRTLAFEATTDRQEHEEPLSESSDPLVERPRYDPPTKILMKGETAPWPTVAAATVRWAEPLVANADISEAKLDTEEESADRDGPESAKEEGSPEPEAGLTLDSEEPMPTPAEDVATEEPQGEPKGDVSEEPQGEPKGDVSEEPAKLREDDEGYYHDGGSLVAEDLEGQMAVLPEIVNTTEEVKIEDIQAGNPKWNTPEEINRLRRIIWRRNHLLIGKGNALLPAAVGVVCDIDVGGAAPIAQRVRRVAPQYHEKLSDLIKGLLAAKIIVPSTSRWASPIVIIIKKNGVDIRLCIDYRLVNSLTRLMVYPMPLINDLLEDLDKVLWYCSLDMASGFWVVQMTERAQKISAFITPFGLFEWTRVPFGLKNAPQIYQWLLDNALYGFLRIGNGEDSEHHVDVFEAGKPETDHKPSVLGRRFYIDDILVTADSWDNLCGKVDKLLDACDRWNLSISVVKSSWGMRKVDYLGHRVSIEGLEARPKDLESLCNLPFPQTLRAMQSFLGSLNYYSRFIEDFAVYAAILYELRESDFFEHCRRSEITDRPSQTGDVHQVENEDRWTITTVAFTMLKAKIVSTPILKHFDPDRPPVIVVYANKWAISAALMQEHDGVFWPVTFTSRILMSNELNYGIVEKEVLALLQILDVCHTMLVAKPIKVLSRYSTLAWLLRSSGLQGRLGSWTALLSQWTLEIVRCTKGEDEVLGTLATSITSREEVDEALVAVATRKQPRQVIVAPTPTLELDEELIVVSFDGSARVKRGGGAYSAVVWKLPEWTILTAASRYATEMIVNESEYHGLLLCLDLLSSFDGGRLVICGDFNLVIRQMCGEIACKAPALQLLREKAMGKLSSWPQHEFVHVKREWNQSADCLASEALQAEEGTVVTSTEIFEDLITLNRLGEILKPKNEESVVRVSAVTRTSTRRRAPPECLQESVVQSMRLERIVKAQGEEKWIADLKTYLTGDVADLAAKDTWTCAKIADSYQVDDDGLLLYCPISTSKSDEDRDTTAKLVIPELLRQDFLHHYHASLEGGHQGIVRTYARIKQHFHWRGLFRDVQRYVGECVDCETGKGRPTIQGRSPGNLQATYPFQIIAMDHIPSLPKSYKGNTELLIWVDLFTGYVLAKASGARTTQQTAESYEESVFRRFGASEVIRHDREPGFMADGFRAFNRIVGQRQSPTMAYRPQANGTAERIVQTLTRSVKMYVADINQKDWDEYTERLTFALNTAQDRVRGDTPFFLVHGWDPRSTLEASLPVGSTRRRDRDPRRWRNHVQSHYQRAREVVNERLREAIRERADHHNEDLRPHHIEAGDQVWLYLDRVKVDYARNLAHLWHGPFRVAEMIDQHAAKLEIAGTEYWIFPIVQVSKLKLVKQFPDRPKLEIVGPDEDRVDFDEALLPEDSWERELDEDEYKVERIADVRSSRKTRYGRNCREFLVHWKGYDDPTWVDEVDLNCGALLREFERSQVSRNHFGVMQSHEDGVGGDPSQ